MVTNSPQEEKNVSPSYERRKALRDADGSNSTITVLNSYPIEKYYIVADRLLGAFQDSFDQRNLDDAYILGIRLATFCLESLPQHKEYSSNSKYKALSAKNAKQIEEVLQKVERVTERMDAEEKIKQQQQQRQKEEEERRRKIELEEETKRILRKEEEKREMMMKKRLEEKEKKKKRQAEVEKSAMSKLATLMKRNNNTTKNEEKKEKEEKVAGNNNKIHASSRKITKTVTDDEKKTTGKGEESATRNNNNEDKNNTTTRGDKIKKPKASLERKNKISNQSNESRKVETKKSSIEPLLLPKGMNNETKSLKNLTIKVDEDYKNDDVKDKNRVPSIAVEVSLSESSNRSPPPGVDNDDDAFSSSYKLISSNKLNKEEQQTILLLHRTIQKQERRLKETEEIKIPKLRMIAKQKLKSGDRKGAIYCMKKKKKLEIKVVESLKDGIFNMETQILLLESAMEDREIAKIMKDATDTIEEMTTMHNHEEIVTDDLSDAITEISKVVEQDMMLDEEELLKELQEETSKKSSSEFVDDDISIPGNENILALPSIPSTKLPEKKKSVKSKISIWT